MKSFILRMFSLVLLGIVSIPTIAQQGKLLLWNTMDSREAVENSVVGPGIMQTTYKFPLWGEAQIVPAKYGNGLYINHDTEEGFKNDGGNFFAIDNEAMGLTAERGAIEFWMTFMYDCTERNHAPMIMMRNELSGHFDDPIDDELGAFFFLIWNGWDYGDYGKRYAISAGYDSDGKGFSAYSEDYSTFPGGDLEFNKGDMAHFALVWDVDGIFGYDANVILFVNGIPVAMIKGKWDTSNGLRKYTYLGTLPNSDPYDHYYNAFNGVIDNLKIWGYARSEYYPMFDHEYVVVCPSTMYPPEYDNEISIPYGEDYGPDATLRPMMYTTCPGEIEYQYEDRDFYQDNETTYSFIRDWHMRDECGTEALCSQFIEIYNVPPFEKPTIHKSASAIGEVPEGMIFWNSMNSKPDVINSLEGPDIRLTSFDVPLWGEARIEPALFGNGLFINHDTERGARNDGANFFAIDNREMNLSSERGTIEFIFKFKEDYTFDNYGWLFIMHNVLAGRFTLDEREDLEGFHLYLLWDGRPDIKRYLTSLGYRGGVWHNGWTSREQSENVKFEKDEIAHFALVWDVNGIEGDYTPGMPRAALYINGIQEAVITEPWPTDMGIRNYTYLGSRPEAEWLDLDSHGNAFKGVMDNLKIWNRALLENEFKENAKTFEGFVETPRMPLYVDDGDISPEKLGYPKVWTLCDSEIVYDYTDVQSGPMDIGKYKNATKIERNWMVTTACGESAKVTQEIYLVDPPVEIESFSVIDPRTNDVIDELPAGSNSYRTLGGNNPWRINLSANLANANMVGSVKFHVNGKWERNENVPPYALAGDRNGDFFKWDVSNMVYFVCATPYSEANGKGTAGEKACVNLTLIFTLPERMEGEGAVWAAEGHNIFDPDSEGYVNYSYNTFFDHYYEEFYGRIDIEVPGFLPELRTRIPVYWYQRTTNAYFLWRASLAGEDGYWLSLRLIFRPNKTLARLVIYRTFDDIVFDTQMGDPYYVPPSETAENAENFISSPPSMPGYEYLNRSISDDIQFETLEDAAVYPNPFDEMIQVVLPYYDDTNNITVKLIDTQGRVVMEQNLATGREHTINTSTLSKGVYLLQLDLPDEKRAVRVVK